MSDNTKEQVLRVVYEGERAAADARKLATTLETLDKEVNAVAKAATKDTAAAIATADKARSDSAKAVNTLLKTYANDAVGAALGGDKQRIDSGRAVNEFLKTFAKEEADAAKRAQQEIVGAAAAAVKTSSSIKCASAGAAGGLDGVAGAARGVGSEFAGLLKAQIGLAAIRSTGTALISTFKDVGDYVRRSAEEFAGLRKSMQEVATLKGVANAGQFTLDEAKKAAAFNLTPTEFRDFQAEFQNYAGSQIGGPQGKLTEAQGENYAGRVAELMKSSGIQPAVGAELAGSLLENAKGPQNVDALMKQLSTTFTVLEKGRVPLGRALPQMSRIMGHGISAVESASSSASHRPSAQVRKEPLSKRQYVRSMRLNPKGQAGSSASHVE